MADFASLMSSIGGQSKNSPSRQTGPNSTLRPQSGKSKPSTDGVGLAPNNTVAGIKRRLEESSLTDKPKVARVSAGGPAVRTSASGTGALNSTNAATSVTASSAPYRGTARSAATNASARPTTKAPPRPVSQPSTSATNAKATTASAPVSRKRGFASIMEKAKAAQEAAKASGSSGIKHKPVERLNKRDRQRQQEETQQQTKKVGKAVAPNQSRGASPAGAKGPKKKAPETSYKGTMKKAPQQLAYKGTMRALQAGEERPKAPTKKGQGQDKYGGYASWSDLDEAEDEEGEEEEEGYDSEASSDMEAAWGDTEREEITALKYAKQEDQDALAEEERLKRDKLERKRRLLELSKSNAAKRKY